jgi:hypothetical protein
MLHCYDNGEGDIVAADTPEQAREWYKKSGGLTDEEAGTVESWCQIDDDKPLEVGFDDGPKGAPRKVTQTSKQWAAEHKETNMVCSSNY